MTEWPLTGVVVAMVVYGFVVAWFRPETVDDWIQQGWFTHNGPSKMEQRLTLWLRRLVMTLMLLSLVYLGVLMVIQLFQ